MMTLLQSALTGWTDYTQHGKFAALLLLAILYLGFVLYGSGKKPMHLGRKSTETAVSLRSAGDIWLYLSRNGTDPVKIPDRLLLLCMDLGGGAPDSIDRMGGNGLSV